MEIRLTQFEVEELEHKMEVILDEEEMWEGRSETELETLKGKIVKGNVSLDAWEHTLLKEEAENLLDIAEHNLDGGFPEYRNDVRKLKALVGKFDLVKREAV